MHVYSIRGKGTDVEVTLPIVTTQDREMEKV